MHLTVCNRAVARSLGDDALTTELKFLKLPEFPELPELTELPVTIAIIAIAGCLGVDDHGVGSEGAGSDVAGVVGTDRELRAISL